MIKKILFVVLLVMPTLLLAQQFGEDIVTLRNGSVIRGIIIEQTPNESIRLQTRDGNIFVFTFDEIQTIGREMSGRNVQRRDRPIREFSEFNNPRGYFGEVALGAGAGTVYVIGVTDVSLSVINGFRFLPQFAIGLGVGVQSLSLSFGGFSYSSNAFPVFLHLRSDFLDRRISPFIVVNSGTTFSQPFAEVILGCSFSIGQRGRLSIGLRGKSVGYDMYYGGSVTTSGLSIGFSW